MNMMNWRKINRCVVCGTKLKFLSSSEPGKKPEEGMKICTQNHNAFMVLGSYDEAKQWHVTFVLPS